MRRSVPARAAAALLVVLFCVALVLRLGITRELEHPGHGDPAFYLTVAQNLAQHGTLDIDYIWHFLEPPESIRHPAADYWMVLCSVLMSVPLLLGFGLFGALVLSTLFGLGVALLVVWTAKRIGAPRAVMLAAVAFVLFHPALVRYSTSTDAPIYATFFVTAALALVAGGTANPRTFALAGVASGLAHLTRQDAVFVLPAILAGALVSRGSRRERLIAGGAAIGAHLVLLTPLVIYNVMHFGALFPKGPQKTMFFRSYQDLYSYPADLSLQSYLEWGWENILESKRAALRGLARILRTLFGSVFLFFGLFALLEPLVTKSRRAALAFLLPVAVYLACQALFYGLIASSVALAGAFQKAALGALPLLALLSFDAIARRVRPWLLASALVVCFAWPLVNDAGQRHATMRVANKLGRELEATRRQLERHLAPGARPIVMARDPWEVHYTLGYPTVQIPHEDFDVIHAVAERYGATHLLLPASRAMRALLKDPRFELLSKVPGGQLRIVRILP